MSNYIYMSTLNQFDGRAGQIPRWVVIHGTAGGDSAIGIAKYFQSTEGSNNPVSANYIVDQSGQVVCLVPEVDAAWANGPLEAGHDPWWSEAINPNYQTISIECCNVSVSNTDPLTHDQTQALFALIKDIGTRWPIPMRKANSSGGITGHFSLLPIERKNCPGENFVWTLLFAFLQGESKPMPKIPDGWSDDGTTLRAPDKKFPITLGFREHILNDTSWLSSNWAVEAAYGVDQLEEQNAALGKGVRQAYRLSQLEWNANRGVFQCWTGTEILALRAKIALLEKQIIEAKPPAK